MPSQDMLFCGFEIRRARGRDVTVYHLQDMSWRTWTLLSKQEASASMDGIGEFYSLADKDKDKVKRYFPWRNREDGLGPIRGYSVTYSPKFGMQAWVFVAVHLQEGWRNMPVLVGEGKVTLRSKSDFRAWWGEAVKEVRKDFPLGLHRFIEFDSVTNRHRFLEEDHEGYVFAEPDDSPSQPAMGASGGGKLPARPAG